MVKPDISVILTSYNVERYIERAVASALSQEDVTLEIIAVDDASTDNTWAILSRITDPRIKTIRLAKNAGPSVARNTALASATADWVAILDGDDTFLPNRLKNCLHRATSQHADIVIDNLAVYREEDGHEYPMFPPEKFATLQTLNLPTFIASNRLFAGSYALGYIKPLFSATFLRQHQLSYDPEIRIGEDYQIMAQALAIGARCAIEPATGYRYTIRAGSISHRLKLEDIARMRACDAKLMAQYTFSPEAHAAQKKREASFHRAYAYTQLLDALKAHNIHTALRAIISCPQCVLMLWMPATLRLRRLWKNLTA